MRYVLLGIFAIYLRIDAAVCDNSEPYTCLHARSDLPECNFTSVKSNHEEIKLDKRLLRKPVEGDRIIIYQLERCIPSKLPFKHPKCTMEDLKNRGVEVHIIFPFESGKFGEMDEPPMVFPKVTKNIDKFRSSNPTHTINYNDEENVNMPIKKSESMQDSTKFHNFYKTKHRHNHINHLLGITMRKESKINSPLLQRLINQVHKNTDNTVPLLFPYDKAIPFDEKKYQRLQNKNKKVEINKYKNVNSNSMGLFSDRLPLNSKELEKIISINPSITVDNNKK